MQTKDFLNAAMKATGCKTDYQLAKALEIPTQRISDFRDGKRRADEYTCTRIAIALGVDPITVIAEVAVEWEKNAERRKWWQDFLASATKPTGVAIIVAFLCLITLPNVSEAGISAKSENVVTYQTIMRSRRYNLKYLTKTITLFRQWSCRLLILVGVRRRIAACASVTILAHAERFVGLFGLDAFQRPKVAGQLRFSAAV